MHGKNIFYKEKFMEIGKGPYCFKDLNESSGSSSYGSNTSATKRGRASRSRAKDTNTIEPNPSTPPVKPKKPVYAGTNPIEPNPSTPPAKPKKPVYAGTNPIEPNPSTPPVKPKKPVYADANPIEPNPTEPPAGHEKPEDTDLNLVEPNHGNSTNDGAKPDSGTLESGVNTEGDTLQKNAVKTNQQQTEDVAVSPIPAANIIADESNKSLSLAKMAKNTMSNSLKWGPENFKTTNKNDMLAAYYDGKVTKKKLEFNEAIDERGKNLPMQKDKNGKVIYPSICQYASVAGSVHLAGYDYKEGLTKEEVEKILNDAVSGEKCKPLTDVIKEIFGLDATYHEIPEGISEKELKALVGDNPAMIKFSQRDFWGNNELPEDGKHGIGYSNGGFIEPYMGRNGKQWEDVRGRSSTADFTKNKGGYYFKINN